MNIQKLAVIVGLIGGLGTLAAWPTGLASALYEHFQLVSSNSQWIRQVEFERLDALRKRRQLTVEEWRRWCTLGRLLGYWQGCPPR